MACISISYALIWQHKDYNYYQWSKCGKLFNLRTGRQLKKCYNGGSLGYCIKGKFVTLNKLRKELIKINEKPF